LSTLLSNANSLKNSCSTIDFICTDSQRVQLFFSSLTCCTNYSY